MEWYVKLIRIPNSNYCDMYAVISSLIWRSNTFHFIFKMVLTLKILNFSTWVQSSMTHTFRIQHHDESFGFLAFHFRCDFDSFVNALIDKTSSFVQNFINFWLILVEKGKKNGSVDGWGAIKRRHAPGQEHALKNLKI